MPLRMRPAVRGCPRVARRDLLLFVDYRRLATALTQYGQVMSALPALIYINAGITVGC
jgi:hypothetical protein